MLWSTKRSSLLGSVLVYCGLVAAMGGLIAVVRPIPRLGIETRVHGLGLAIAGMVVLCLGLVLPAPEMRIERAKTRLDEFVPVWQFREFHTISIAAPPARVFEAIRHVRADEIFLFDTLTWIRRGGRPPPESILTAGDRPLLDVATRAGFVYLADEFPRELAVGTMVMSPRMPRGARETLTPEIFRKTLPPGFALAAMNFVITPQDHGSVVSTETRVFANSASARRRFAAYWRVIYPGSAIIRRMWLRAIRQRAIVSPALSGV